MLSHNHLPFQGILSLLVPFENKVRKTFHFREVAPYAGRLHLIPIRIHNSPLCEQRNHIEPNILGKPC